MQLPVYDLYMSLKGKSLDGALPCKVNLPKVSKLLIANIQRDRDVCDCLNFVTFLLFDELVAHQTTLLFCWAVRLQ